MTAIVVGFDGLCSTSRKTRGCWSWAATGAALSGGRCSVRSATPCSTTHRARWPSCARAADRLGASSSVGGYRPPIHQPVPGLPGEVGADTRPDRLVSASASLQETRTLRPFDLLAMRPHGRDERLGHRPRSVHCAGVIRYRRRRCSSGGRAHGRNRSSPPGPPATRAGPTRWDRCCWSGATAHSRRTRESFPRCPRRWSACPSR